MAHLTVTAIPVNHIVPTVGVIVSDGKQTVAFSSDTSETDDFVEGNQQPTAPRRRAD